MPDRQGIVTTDSPSIPPERDPRDPRDPRPPRDRRHALLIAVALLALTLAAFAGVVRCGFVNFDDNEYVYANRHVLAGLSWSGTAWAFSTGRMGNYNPLVWLSLMLDRQLWGPGPLGFHLTNLALHAADVLLLFAVLRSITGATWRSALVAAVFAVHPLRVESVAWISERKD